MTTPTTGPFVSGIDLTAAPKPITINGTSFAGQLVTGMGLIIAGTYANNGATAVAAFSIRDGTDSSGRLLVTVKAPGGTGSSIAIAAPGIWFSNGLFFVSGGGSITWTLTYLPYLTEPS